MSGERPRRSGSNAPARFGSGCGFRPEGEGEAVIRAQTGAWFFLEIGGFLQKNGNYRSKQGCTTRNGRTYAAWRTIECITMESNASSAIRVLFPDRDERVRIGKRTIRFRIHYAPKTKNLTYHWYIRILLLVSFSFKGSPSGKRDSDPRPQPWQGCALPTELFPQNAVTDWFIWFYGHVSEDVLPRFSHWLNGWLNIYVCLLVCKWLLIRELFNGLNKFCNTFFLVIHWHSEFMVSK